MSRLSLGLAIIWVVSLVLSFSYAQPVVVEDAGATVEAKDDRDLVEIEVDGTVYIVPVYRKVDVSEKKLEFDRKMIETLMTDVDAMMRYLFKGQGSSIWILSGMTRNLINISSEGKKLDKEEKKPGQADDGYGTTMGKLLQDILNAESSQKLADHELEKRVENFLEAVKQVPIKSPTGLYVDWPLMKIGPQKESLVEHVAPVISWFKKSKSRKLALKAIGLFAKFIC